jgi:hypothetical protein
MNEQTKDLTLEFATLLLQQRDDEAAETLRLLDDAEDLAYCTLCEATTP